MTSFDHLRFGSAGMNQGHLPRWLRNGLAAVVGTMLALQATLMPAQAAPLIKPIVTPDDARLYGLESLKLSVAKNGLPLPPDLNLYVRDLKAARMLGKALFHEMAVSSDGVTACASCHYRVGADNRSKNQLSPGLLRRADVRNGHVVGYSDATRSGDNRFETPFGANFQLRRDDFPFVRDIGSGPTNGDNLLRSGAPLVESTAADNRNEVVGSQGVFYTHFDGIKPGVTTDFGKPLADVINNVRGINARRVPPRNTPSTINAVFNYVNFWDGRANNRFNGVNPFGPQDGNARVFKLVNGAVTPVKIDLVNASLASQAVGPPLSDIEMSHGGDGSFRIFPQLGRKLLSMRVLANQTIAYDDSLLGADRDRSGKGLTMTYEQLIAQAFRPEFVTAGTQRVRINAPRRSEVATDNFAVNHGVATVDVSGSGDPGSSYTLTEANFSLFWGLSIMLYEVMLVADQSPFDNWMQGIADPGFGQAELAGLNLFVSKGNCVFCHGGAEFSSISVNRTLNGKLLIEPMVQGNGKTTLYDAGFYNLGITPTLDDIGRGARDPFGAPLSFTRQLMTKILGIQTAPFAIQGAPLQLLFCDPADTTPNCQSHALGFFVAPVDAIIVPDPNPEPRTGQFNQVCIDLNADGFCGEGDQFQVKKVTADGGFKVPQLRNVADTAPYFHNGGAASLREVVEFYNRGGNFCNTNKADLAPLIVPLGLTEQEKDDLVSFLLALTDARVAVRKAPFDAPEFRVPNGHPGDSVLVTKSKGSGSIEAADDLVIIPAVGQGGGAALPPFLTTQGNLRNWQRQANAVMGGLCMLAP